MQRSLLEGHQILLLRKGGLIEETGEFALQAERFLLYPTYEHETERLGDVQECFGAWLREEEAAKPPPSQVRFGSFADVTDIVRIDDREPLLKLSPQHIWNKQFIDGRFDWEPYKPVFALLVRAWILPEPVTLPVLPRYGGCKSWVDLETPVSIEGARPALPDDHYARRRELTLRVLQPSVLPASSHLRGED